MTAVSVFVKRKALVRLKIGMTLCSAMLVAGVPADADQPTSNPASIDLTLDDALQTAFANNPTIRVFAANYAAARDRLAETIAQKRISIIFNSNLSGSNASVIQPPPGQETFGTWQNSITVPIPIGSRPALAIAQANAQADAAEAQCQSARLTLASQIAADYYDILRREALLDNANAAKSEADRQLDETSRRYKSGDAPELDLLRAQVPAATADSAVQQAENDLSASEQTLNMAMGRDIDTPVAPNRSAILPMPDITLQQARQMAVDASADVRSADESITAIDLANRYARNWQQPTLSLQASDLRSGDETSFSREETVGAGLTVPLDDGGLGRAQTHEAEASLDQARASATQARNTAVITVSTAYLDAESDQAVAASAATAAQNAEVSYSKTIEGYHNGLFPFSDVLTAQTALHQARAALAQAEYDQAASTTDLLILIGRYPGLNVEAVSNRKGAK